jgi:D-sedoheptulose 7-phosphate isomerase
VPVTAPRARDALEAFARRDAVAGALADLTGPLVDACRAMAARFGAGGRLLAFGNGAAGADPGHVAVEFMHPVTVGRRALPALALGNDTATLSGLGARDGFDRVFAHQLRHFGGPDDIALGVTPDGRCGNVRQGLRAAAGLGLLTVVLAGGDAADLPAADHALLVPAADPLIVKEAHVTAYHVMWELVHLFLETP